MIALIVKGTIRYYNICWMGIYWVGVSFWFLTSLLLRTNHNQWQLTC